MTVALAIPLRDGGRLTAQVVATAAGRIAGRSCDVTLTTDMLVLDVPSLGRRWSVDLLDLAAAAADEIERQLQGAEP